MNFTLTNENQSIFSMDERLKKDTIEVGNFPHCCVRLMNDRRFVWLVLIPMQDSLVEMTDLSEFDREMVWKEVDKCSVVLKVLFPNSKINIGTLGNVVRQLHIHVVARHEGDAAWPGPVWGAGVAEAYSDEKLVEIINQIRKAL